MNAGQGNPFRLTLSKDEHSPGPSKPPEDDNITAHVLRHTFATRLVRGHTDLVIVAELLGHARLETTRAYTRPSAEDRTRALDVLLIDK